MSVISKYEVASLLQLSAEVVLRPITVVLCVLFVFKSNSILWMQLASSLPRDGTSTGLNLQQETLTSLADGAFYSNQPQMFKNRDGHKLSKKGDPTSIILSKVLQKCYTETGYRTESLNYLLADLGDSKICIWGQISWTIYVSSWGAFSNLIYGYEIGTKTIYLKEVQKGTAKTDYETELLKVIMPSKKMLDVLKPFKSTVSKPLSPTMSPKTFENDQPKSGTLISEVEELNSDRSPNFNCNGFKLSESIDENRVRSPIIAKKRKCPDETKWLTKRSRPLEVANSTFNQFFWIDLPQEFKEYRKSPETLKSTTAIVNETSSNFKFSLQDDKKKHEEICDLCQETVAKKKFFAERRFGILTKCDCVICYGCIRKEIPTSGKLVKGPIECPSCFVESDTVASSSRWIEGEAKDAFFRIYRENTANLSEMSRQLN